METFEEKHGVKLLWNGKRYKSLTDLSKASKVSYSRLYHRLVRDGYTVDEAIAYYRGEYSKGIFYKGKSYKSYRQLADKYGIGERRIYSLRGQGWEDTEIFSKLLGDR